MDYQDQIEIGMLFEDAPPMASKKVAVVIGRFSPPTKGHYEIINQARSFIKKNPKLGLEAFPVVVVIGGSKSDADKKRNPLSVDERINFMKASGNANGVTILSATNAFAAFTVLRENGFEPIAICAGSDRAPEYVKILDKHFKTPEGEPIEHHTINIARDEAAVETKKDDKAKALDSVLNMMHKNGGKDVDTDLVSGSLARRAVELGYEEEFAAITGLSSKPVLAKKMFGIIKKAMSE